MPRNGAKDSLIFYESLLSPCNFVRTTNILVGRYENFIIIISRSSANAEYPYPWQSFQIWTIAHLAAAQTIFIVPARTFSSGLAFQPTLRAVP